MTAPVPVDELVPLVAGEPPAAGDGDTHGAAADPSRRGRRWRPWRPWRRGAPDVDGDRRLLSSFDWRRPGVRWFMRGSDTAAFVLLFVAGVGPILWLAKAATSTTQDTLRTPFALWPSGVDWENLSTAWTKVEISQYFGNTLEVALGSWAVQLLVATTGGFVLSVLRPRYAGVLTAAVLATLFIPGIVVLVPLFLTVLDLPVFGTSLVDSYWAVWLPAGANAFNILLVKRFMDGLPRELFEAAQVDGAGPFRQLWYVALPLSRPILGVVSVLAMLNAWKDFLWPMIVLPNPEIQPLSVRLPIIRDTVELDVFLAALLISMALPIVLFLVFQRLFLRNVSIGGAVKG